MCKYSLIKPVCHFKSVLKNRGGLEFDSPLHFWSDKTEETHWLTSRELCNLMFARWTITHTPEEFGFSCPLIKVINAEVLYCVIRKADLAFKGLFKRVSGLFCCFGCMLYCYGPSTSAIAQLMPDHEYVAGILCSFLIQCGLESAPPANLLQCF